MNAGALRHRITLQQPIETQDEFGEVVITWQDVASVWAEVADLSGREFFAAMQTVSEITTRVRLRHRSDVETRWRMVVGARVLDIQAVIDPDGRKRELLLLCREVA